MSPDPLDVLAVSTLEPLQAEALAKILAGMDPWRTLGYGWEALAVSLQAVHPDVARYLAQRDGETLGLAVVRYPWLRGAYIELLAVLPGAQRQGIGAALLGQIQAAHQGRTPNLWLLVSAFNAPARRFYERHGFRAIGVIPDLVVQGQDEVLMRKRLPPVAAAVPHGA